MDQRVKYVVMFYKEGSTIIENFMTPRGEVLELGDDQIVKIQYFISSSCIHWGMNQTN